MEGKKVLNKIKKLKPKNENVPIKYKKDEVFDEIKKKHKKIYFKLIKKNN